MIWSRTAPVADWPASVSQRSGIIAEKYGPQTPGMNLGSRETAIWQEDVPAISATREFSNSGVRISPPSTAPSTPRPPACASIIDVPTAVPARKPSSFAADSDKPLPTGAPIGLTVVPILLYFSVTNSPNPICRQYESLQPARSPCSRL